MIKYFAKVYLKDEVGLIKIFQLLNEVTQIDKLREHIADSLNKKKSIIIFALLNESTTKITVKKQKFLTHSE